MSSGVASDLWIGMGFRPAELRVRNAGLVVARGRRLAGASARESVVPADRRGTQKGLMKVAFGSPVVERNRDGVSPVRMTAVDAG